MITSKLTTKAQTTIPRAVRRQLGLREGDLLGYVIEGEKVWLCVPLTPARDAPPSLLREWESEEDQRAFYGL